MSTSTLLSPGVVSRPYPHLGGSQHLCLVRHSGSQRVSSPFMLDWQQLPNTVLASAFVKGAEVTLPVPLEPPFDQLKLPPLTLDQLQPRQAKDKNGRVIGMLLSVPGLYVHANNILTHSLNANPRYNYRQTISLMALEAARMLATVVRSGVLRVRERPGIMGHAIAIGELARDEIGISTEFAGMLLRQNKRHLKELVGNIWQLDGFPCWGIRFPVANEFGIQPKALRILPGRGQFVGFNPWDLGKRYLGDQDGDLGFSILRVNDILDGRAFMEKRKRVSLNGEITRIRNPLTLQNILDPSLLDHPKAEKLLQSDLTTQEKRLQFIQDCDTRTWVAVFTMVLGWWCPRILAASGTMGIQEAYVRCHQMLEWWMEECMDGRKGDSLLSRVNFDWYRFMDGLLGSGEVDTSQLQGIVPEHALGALNMALQVSGGKLRRYCASSPVYDALVLRRRVMSHSAVDMLDSLRTLGIEPGNLYQTILEDLICLSPLDGNTSMSPSGVSDLDFDMEEL